MCANAKRALDKISGRVQIAYAIRVDVDHIAGIVRCAPAGVILLSNFKEGLSNVGEVAAIRDLEGSVIAMCWFVRSDLVRLHLKGLG